MEEPEFDPAQLRKYSYEEVSQDVALYTRIALAYLEQYKGTWGPILDIKDKINEGCDVTVGMIKTVLNTMLHDPSVINMPRRSKPIFNASAPSLLSGSYSWHSVAPLRRIEVRKRPFELKGKWKKPFGVATGRAAYVIHALDKNVSPFKYYPAAETKYWPQIRWFCSGERRKEESTRFLTLAEAHELVGSTNGNGKKHWRWCVICDDMLYAWEHRDEVRKVTTG